MMHTTKPQIEHTPLATSVVALQIAVFVTSKSIFFLHILQKPRSISTAKAQLAVMAMATMWCKKCRKHVSVYILVAEAERAPRTPGVVWIGGQCMYCVTYLRTICVQDATGHLYC